jgi:acyl carrier protein
VSEVEILQALPDAFAQAWIALDVDLARDLALEDIEGLDSVSRVRLMLSVEETFGIVMSAREHGRLKTVGDLIDLIHAKRESI